MIRILHIVHAITKGGGLCNMIMNYYRFIDRTKIQFDFLYFRCSEDTFQAEIESLGGRCFKMSEPSVSIAFFKEREEFFKLHKGEWKTIHCHVLFASAIFTKVAKRNRVSYSFSHSHSKSFGYGMDNPIKRLRNSYFVHRAKVLGDVYLACSEDAALFMFGNKEFLNGKAVIIKNAINLDRYWFNIEQRNKMRHELGVENKMVVGHVGGFAPQKNHTFLIDVFYNFQKKHPDSVLLLTGGEGIATGSTKKSLVDKIKSYDITDKVKFLGLRDDVYAVNQALDVFVFPSLFEGLGIVLVEAQAAGLPCIVSPAVPKETYVLPNYVSMDNLDNVESWSVAIENALKYDIQKRYVNHELFNDYNIKKQCIVLEQIYLSE